MTCMAAAPPASRCKNSVIYQIKVQSSMIVPRSHIYGRIVWNVPTLTYQCQTWTMTKPLERKITTCEMRCLRKAVSKARRDMIPNTKIREMVGTKGINHHIQQQRIKWFGHLTRLRVQYTPQRAYNTKFSGRKARGRPRKTWTNGVKETLSLYNIPSAQAFRCSADKRLFLPTTPRVVYAVDKSKVSE